MNAIIIFLISLMPCSTYALVYNVHVVYPWGTVEPTFKDILHDTRKDGRTNEIPLRDSKFKCRSDVFDFESVYSIQVICKNGDEQTFSSSSHCAEGVKLEKFAPIVSLKEHPPKGTGLNNSGSSPTWEHTISVECNPGMPTTLEKLLQKKGKK